ncbi:hypothetical protein SO802_001991 [Lithocarpus litseifolius]|uniref:Uncharacterized protein n=1 Tax=Lithocarpus litseifolius TaxID=425828 RepID=A0AAW2DWI4_9ROSI
MHPQLNCLKPTNDFSFARTAHTSQRRENQKPSSSSASHSFALSSNRSITKA